jgi:hypothetical protein
LTLSYTTTRARVEKPNQGVPPSAAGCARRLAGMASSSSFDLIGRNNPSCSPRHRRAASTSRITSAGEALPSAFRRAMMPASSASTRLILMPVVLVKSL